MYDAVITFVTEDKGDGVGEFGDIKNIITKVYRLEFESEEDFAKWLVSDRAADGTQIRMVDCVTQLVVSDSGSFDL
jgi:hypothetical protein